jgi:hypothetical protein
MSLTITPLGVGLGAREPQLLVSHVERVRSSSIVVSVIVGGALSGTRRRGGSAYRGCGRLARGRVTRSGAASDRWLRRAR